MTDTMTPEQVAALEAQQQQTVTTPMDNLPPVVTTEQLVGADGQPPAPEFTAEQLAMIAANSAQPPAPEPKPDGVSYLEHVGLTLDEMRIAMHSDTEVTFTNGKTIPIVGFVGADGQPVGSLAQAKTILAGDGSVSIPLPY